MKGIILFIIVIVLLLTAIVVGARNNEIVTLNYLIAQIDLRISVLMAICIGLGIFVGISTMLTKYLALKLRFAHMKRRRYSDLRAIRGPRRQRARWRTSMACGARRMAASPRWRSSTRWCSSRPETSC